MKKLYLLIILLIFPLIVNAETLTYNICKSGCEYSSLYSVNSNINSITDLSDKDIIINFNYDARDHLQIGDFDNQAKSIIINGNNNDFGSEAFDLYAKKVEINDCDIRNIATYSDKTSINHSSIDNYVFAVASLNDDSTPYEYNLSEVLSIDKYSLNNIKLLGLAGNIKIENTDFSNNVLLFEGGIINIHNSILNKIIAVPVLNDIYANIYNSKFKSIKYLSENDVVWNEIEQYFSSDFNDALLNYDIYNMDGIPIGMQTKSTTTIYFDKEAKLKPNERLNLVNYLDYYTEDKEIEYTIEDESIAKIENKELIGLKEGSTKVTVTTDEGHVVYRINLVVEKETIPEKIDKMTIKVPITGSKVKAWVVVVSILLLGIVGLCVYMLIKRKK